MIAVLFLEPVSKSMLPPMPSPATWIRALRRISALGENTDLRILVSNDYALDVVTAAVSESPGTSVFLYAEPTQLRASVEMLRQERKQPQQLAFVTLASIFAPKGCLDVLLAAHIQHQSWLTSLSGLGNCVSPLIVGGELLDLAMAADRFTPTAQPALVDVLEQCISVASISTPTARRVRVDISNFTDSAYTSAFEVDLTSTYDAVDALERISAQLDTATDGPTLALIWKEAFLDRAPKWPDLHLRKLHSGCLRVLYVSSASAYSGAEESLCRLIQHLDPTQIAAHVVVGFDGLFAERLRALGVTVIVAGRDFSWSSADSFRQLTNIVLETKPDVVHLNGYCGLPAIVAAKTWGSPVILHARTAQVAPISGVLSDIDAIVAVSDYVRKRFITAGVDPGKVFRVYDGVEAAACTPVSACERRSLKVHWGIDPETLTILMVARYDYRKRHDILINAFAQLTHGEHSRNVLLLLAGESLGDLHCERAVDLLIEKHKLGKCVRKLGFQQDIGRLEAVADIAVLCSQEEPLGTFVLESMARGVPVIIGEDGGLREIVALDPPAGIVVESGSRDALTLAFQKLVDNEHLRAELGTRGRNRVLGMCEMRASAQNILEIYRRVCD